MSISLLLVVKAMYSCLVTYTGAVPAEHYSLQSRPVSAHGAFKSSNRNKSKQCFPQIFKGFRKILFCQHCLSEQVKYIFNGTLNLPKKDISTSDIMMIFVSGLRQLSEESQHVLPWA